MPLTNDERHKGADLVGTCALMTARVDVLEALGLLLGAAKVLTIEIRLIAKTNPEAGKALDSLWMTAFQAVHAEVEQRS